MLDGNLHGDIEGIDPRALVYLRSPQIMPLPSDLLVDLKAGSRIDIEAAKAIELRFALGNGHGERVRTMLDDAAPSTFDHPLVRWLYQNAHGFVFHDYGDYPTSLAAYERAAEIAADAGLVRERRITLLNAAEAACHGAMPNEFRRFMTVLAEQESTETKMQVTLAMWFEALGDFPSAHQHLSSADPDETREGTGQLVGIEAANMLCEMGDLDGAKDVVARLDPIHDYDYRQRSRYNLVRARLLLAEDPLASAEAASEALRYAEKVKRRDFIVDSRAALGSALLELGELDKAEAAVKIDPVQLRLSPVRRDNIFRVQANIFWALGRPQEALRAHRQLQQRLALAMSMRAMVWEVSRDLMALRRSNQALEELESVNEQLMSATESMTVSAAAVAHDLRSSLTTLTIGLDNPSASPRMVDLMNSAVKTASDMARQAAWATRLDEPGVDSDADLSFDLVDTVSSAVDQFRAAATAKGQTIELTFEIDRAPVKGPSALGMQTASNLIQNAIRYTPRGGTARVSVQPVDTDPAEWVMLVSDTGVGVPAGEHTRIFERFVRVGKPTGGEASVGLGLYIVRRAVERLGGKVRSVPDPDPGIGALFEVRLPQAAFAAG